MILNMPDKLQKNCQNWSIYIWQVTCGSKNNFYAPPSKDPGGGGGGVLFYRCPSVCPSVCTNLMWKQHFPITPKLIYLQG